MQQLLLIDDDERLADLLKQYLQQFDLELFSSTRPSEGLKALQSRSFDLVILDVMLPEMDGFEVCKAIRKQSDIPIIMLTARGEVMDRVVGLEIGADDYMPKPFEPRELVARIQNILKRIHSKSPTSCHLEFGALRIDMGGKLALLDDSPLPLSTMEYLLLELFAKAPGKIFSRDEILNQLRGIDTELYSRSVDILVSRLRHKLKPLDVIKTMRGHGYVFTGKAT